MNFSGEKNRRCIEESRQRVQKQVTKEIYGVGVEGSSQENDERYR